MNRRKNLFAVVSALVASSTFGQADLVFTQGTDRIYRQSPTDVSFRSGSLLLTLRDGNYTYDAICPLNRSLAYYAPINPIPPCPLGATGFIVGGDVDDDGNRDDFTYWSVIDVVPAFYIEPSRPDLCTISSAPPSKLPRNISGFTNWTVDVYFNIQSEAITEYNLTLYRYDRPYTDRGQMDDEVVTGTYRWSFPRLNNPDGTKVIIPVENYPIPEGRIKKSNHWSGFRFLRLNGRPLVWNANGFVAMDPRVANTFDWEGNIPDSIFPGRDELFFSLAKLAAAPAGDPTRNYAFDVLGRVDSYYPGFVAPGTSHVLLTHPLVTQGVVPPGMIQIPAPIGTPPSGEGVLRVELQRTLPTGGVSYDTSHRVFELPIVFTNTYAGWATVRFPAGTSAGMRDPNADPDNDGFINSREWTANTNPMNAAAPWPPAPALAFVQGRSLRSTDSATTGYWETNHQKTPGAWPPIEYDYEFSTDLKNWSVVAEDNPDWAVVETENELQIRSRHEKLSGQGFLRVKMTQLPEPPPQVVE